MHQAGAARGLSSRAVAVSLLVAPSVSLAGYRIERIASGLNQPTYITQAPGAAPNILYYTERTRNANAGFGAPNDLGRVWKYDTTTRTKALVLDLIGNGTVTNDTGLQSLAFHPNFNNVGSAGFGKMYVSYSTAGPSIATNHVEEYNVGAGGTATLDHLVLRYTNGAQNNHTVNWIGFDPNAAGAARNYLYVSTGDGAFGLNYNGGTFNGGRPSQNPLSVRGKMLRLDITAGADAYPATDRNYGIPASNPIPVYNASNPDINGLGEVWLTGLRNVSRASFDRANSDLYMGDVGETSVEEVSFLKAGTNTGATPPVDYGWPLKEGTQDSGIAGIPGGTNRNVNPFTGAVAVNPIRQFNHTAGGNAVIGGYVHRGPVADIAGKYFYADFVPGRILQLDFDRDTPIGSFNGNNGTLTDVTQRFGSRVFDPTDPTYFSSSNIADLPGIDHIVSFGEDNAGNMYIVDFGPGTGFDGQYPGTGLGEIFRVITGTIDATWNVDSSGSWLTASNWTPGGVPGMVGDQATLGGVITAPRTVSCDGVQTISTLTLNSVHSYTISGPGILAFQGLSPGVVTVNNGTHTISALVSLPGDLQVQTAANAGVRFDWPLTDASGDTLTKLGPGFAQFLSLRAGTLAATEGTVKFISKISPNALGAVVENLVIGATGQVDLTNNSMVISYTAPVGTLVDDTRVNLLSRRLFSSDAAAGKTLGYGDNAVLGFGTFAGQTVDSSSILVKFTYAGDADLDGDVDVGDLGSLASSWQSAAVWTGGDFDYNGSVDVNDLGLLASNWQAGVGNPLGPGSLSEALASLGLPSVAVPEPGAAMLILATTVLMRRRRVGGPDFL